MLIRTRDAEFKEFFMAESAALARLGTFLTGDPERGADLAQEALVRTYQHWGRIKDQDPAPYARRILVNLVRSAHRRKMLERRHPPRSHVVASSRSGDVDEWIRVSEALRALPPIRRAAVVLRFYEDMSEMQIADTLNRPLGTVKSDIHRGLAALRPLLSEETAREAL
jgi:RNA polymerase sigma-70 factor (sigma-E family)